MSEEKEKTGATEPTEVSEPMGMSETLSNPEPMKSPKLTDAPKPMEASELLESPRYMAEALLLANSYTKMLEEKARLEKLLAGSWVYTKDMAIDELDNITVSYEGERVQTSNISNPTERIALKLTDEYMARKQAEMDAERNAVVSELEYLNWKIGVVETTARERMSEKQRDIFTLQYVGHRTYKQTERAIRQKRRSSVYSDRIRIQKKECIEKLIQELVLCSAAGRNGVFMSRLSSETCLETSREVCDG